MQHTCDKVTHRLRRFGPDFIIDDQTQNVAQKRSYISISESAAAASSNINVEPDSSSKRYNHRKKRTKITSLVSEATLWDIIPSGAQKLSPATYCKICDAKKFQYEPPGFCCSNGEVKVASNSFPDELLYLYTSKTPEADHFQKHARIYNNMFAFSSLGGTIDCKTERGIYVFRLHGQIYHFLPDLLPAHEYPKYLQLYFYDSHAEHSLRSGFFDNLRPDVISLLMSVMLRNPYAQFFKSLKDISMSNDTTIHINTNAVVDPRTYNAPTSDEVAAIWTDQVGTEDRTGPFITVTGKSGTSHRIQHYYGCYDPLQYPLLLPYGDSGWHPGIPRFPKSSTDVPAYDRGPIQQTNDLENLLVQEESRSAMPKKKPHKDISCREYYAYLLQIRRGNPVLATGRLLLQYIVDMYVKLETTRLDFYRHNQPKIRADLYKGLIDAIVMGEVRGANAGHRIVLPPSFIGGPRDLRRRYLNAMTLVQRFGKPDIFATMTCNPNWPEIKAELKDGEQAQNRPDLIARIFRAKLMAAKKEMIDKCLFGDVAAFVYVVEFQKRGLPHAHFLIILKNDCKIRRPEDYDRFISAEIPSLSQSHLRNAVLNHMIHGPCGVANPECPCMKQDGNKKYCKFRYPKNYSDHTTTNDDGYPLYRRRNTGEKVMIRKNEMDNRWVIPYNPYLLALFDCHFNVEICSTIQAVKYLYKYVYKGHDRISFLVGDSYDGEPINEINNFQSGRWVSPPEAAWRIFGFDLHEMSPPVMPLAIHCENNQNISFAPEEQLQAIVSDLRRAQTPLTEFFSIHKSNTEGHKYLYSEMPEYFIWNDRGRFWQRRKRGFMVGRLTFVNPSDPDRYYLRMLLANVRGPTSFEDLKSVDGYVCTTYKEACVKRGLIEQFELADQCLAEALEVQMPQALRSLFVTLLIFCQPTNPAQLWDKYYSHLSEDFRYRSRFDEDKILALTVERIEHLLEHMGKTFSEFGLGHLKQAQDNQMRITRDIRDVMEAPIAEKYIQARKQLNHEQNKAYKAIIQKVKQNIPGAFFVDGPGGTGKTFLYCALYAKVRGMGKIVLPTASSGIAAAGLPNGRTAHSRFKLPIDHDITLTCNVPKQGSLAELLKETTLIIWDEAPMANKSSVHALDLLLRDLCNPNILFGGKIVVFGGDFRQVLPVLPHKTQKEAVEASLVSSHLWPCFQKFHLHENMRAQEDPTFAAYLLALGNGNLQDTEQALVPLPSNSNCVIIENNSTPVQVMPELFNQKVSYDTDPSLFNTRAILTPKNDDVDTINSSFIEAFHGENITYKSFDTLLDDNCHIYPTEFLNTLCPGGMSPHELVLKKNCPVMLLRNLDPSSGLCNGTRLTCKQFLPNLIVCEIAAGSFQGKQVFLPRITLRPSASSNFPFQFQRKQFPIKLSFAMTINKAQGQTLTEVGIYLTRPCFSHGQLYVALSRARMASNIKVFILPSQATQPSQVVRNIISYEILSRAGIKQICRNAV